MIKKRYVLLSIGFLLLAFSASLANPMIQALNSYFKLNNVVVTLDNPNGTPEISEALSTIKESYPKIRVVQYGSDDFKRVTGAYQVYNYIFIGHGSEDYIVVNGQAVDWETFCADISKIKARKFYFANCYSKRVLDFLPSEKVALTFESITDATVAGQLTAAFLKGFEGAREEAQDLVLNAISTSLGIFSGKKELSPLLWMGNPNFKDQEIYFTFGELLIILLAACVSDSIIASGAAKLGANALVAAKIGHLGVHILHIIDGALAGAGFVHLVDHFFGFLEETIPFLGTYIIARLSLWDLLLFGTILVATVILAIASGSAYLALKIAAYAVIGGVWLAWLLIDTADADGVWHHTSHHSGGGGSGGGGGGGKYK